MHKTKEINPLTLGQQWQRQLRCECHIWWGQCRLIDKRSWMWLKKTHVVVLVPRGSQHLAQWQQRCHEPHHGILCVHCHEHIVRGGYHRVNGMHAHTSKNTYYWGMGCSKLRPKYRGKNEENNRKVVKVGRVISQALTPGLEHDKIRTRWVSNISSESMLEKIWWCKHFKMESWNQTIWYLIK